MLKPTKHSHPDKTLLFTSVIILKKLKELRVVNYGDLLQFTKKTVSGGDRLFLPALNFLFLTGVVEYRPKTDSIEFVASQQ